MEHISRTKKDTVIIPVSAMAQEYINLLREVLRMINKQNYDDGECGRSMENFTVQLTDSLMYDRLHLLSAEYSVSVEMLVNLAVKRLVDDVDFVRNLRTGKIEGA